MRTEVKKIEITDEEWFEKCRYVASSIYNSKRILDRLSEKFSGNLRNLNAEERNQIRVLIDIADGIVERHNASMKSQVTKIEALRYNRSWYKSAYFQIINIRQVKELAEAGNESWEIVNIIKRQP